MEKTVHIITALAMLFHMMTPQAYGQTDYQQRYQILTQIATDQNLPIQAIIIEGWLPLEQSKLALLTLQQQLGMQQGQTSYIKTWVDGSTLQLYVHQKEKQTIVEFQLLTQSSALGEQYYQTFQQFSNQFAKGTLVGITLSASLDEALQPQACQYITDDIAQHTQSQILSATNDNHHQSYVLYSQAIGQALNVAGQQVNINIAYRCNDQETKIYLASPIIYQQY